MASLAARESLIAMIAAPLVWAAHFLIIYVFQAVMCHFRLAGATLFGLDLVRLGIALVTVAALGLIGWVLLTAWERWRSIPASESSDPGHAEETRSRFLAFATWSLAALSLVTVVWQTLPALLLPVCR